MARSPGRSLTLFSFMVFGLIAGAFIARLQFGHHQAEQLPRYGKAPLFELQSSGESMFKSVDMSGRVYTLNFFFTSCPAVCPAVMGRLAAIAATHRNDPDFRLVSITVDPDTDDAATLERFREKLGVPMEQWALLTGKPEVIRALRAQSLKLDSGVEIEMHTTRVLLIDQQGEIRGFYQGVEDDSMKALQRDIQRLLAS